MSVKTPHEFLKEFGGLGYDEDALVYPPDEIVPPAPNDLDNNEKQRDLVEPERGEGGKLVLSNSNIIIISAVIFFSVLMQLLMDRSGSVPDPDLFSFQLSEKSFLSLISGELSHFEDFKGFSEKLLSDEVSSIASQHKFTDSLPLMEESKATFTMLYDSLKSRADLAENTKALEQSIKSMKGKLKTEMALYSKKTQALSNLNKDFTILDQNLKSINASIKYLREDMNERLFLLRDLNSRRSPLSMKHSALDQTISEKASALHRLEEKQNKIHGDIKYSKEQLKSASYTESVKLRAISSLKSQIEESKHKIESILDLARISNSQKQELERSAALQIKEIDQQRKKISKFEHIYKSEEREVALSSSNDIQNQMMHLKQSIQELEEMQNDPDMNEMYLNGAIEQKQEKLKLLQKYATEMKSNAPTETSTALKFEKDILSVKENELHKLKIEINRVNEVLDKHSKEEKKLRNQIDSYENEIKGLEVELETESVSGVQKRIADLEGKLAMVEKEIIAASEEKATLDRELKGYATDLDQVYTRIVEIEKRCQDIRSELIAKDKHYGDLKTEKDILIKKSSSAAHQTEQVRVRVSKLLETINASIQKHSEDKLILQNDAPLSEMLNKLSDQLNVLLHRQ